MTRGGAIAVAGLAIVAGVGAWMLLRDPGSPRAERVMDGGRPAPRPPGLLGGRTSSVGASPAGESAGDQAGASGDQSGPVLREIPARLRLAATLPGGAEEEVAAEVLHVRRRDLSLPFFPGELVEIRTQAPRVAFPLVRTELPNPVPKTLVLSLPTIDDPAIQTALVHVVDDETSAALPEATFTFEDPALAPLHADEHGRIRFERVKDATGLRRWLTSPGTLSAPGYLSFVPRSRLWWFGSTEVPANLADLDAWRKDPVLRVRLQRVPRGADERRVRLLHADGKPAEGLQVVVLWPQLTEISLYVGPGFTDGVRRVGPTGEIAFPMQRVVGLDVRKNELPVLSYLLTADRWPTSGARDIRLPPLSDIEVTLLDAPDVTDGEWMDADDELGAARTPSDPPIHPPEGDPEAKEQLESESLAIPVGITAIRGSLAPRTATARFSARVGAARTLRFRYGRESRLLALKPPKAGPISIRTRWADLPLSDTKND